MSSFLTDIQVNLLRRISPGSLDGLSNGVYEGKSKLTTLLGEEFFQRIQNKSVVDFGCGEGIQAVEMAAQGARRVIGVDILQDSLATGRRRAIAAGVQDRCVFASDTNEHADIVVSLDAFEHFSDPADILQSMSALLKPGGEAIISFGPTWYHPLGGHLFSVFPWAHLVFSEQALIRWRSAFKSDGATRFGEVAGGLNQITIGQFERLIAQSPMEFSSVELVPIRKFQAIHNRLTREFTTAIVRCRLVKRTSAERTVAATAGR